MQLEHQFTVPAPQEIVWKALIDPERVAPCMPGATLASVEGSRFAGTVKVKLGPISLLYKGSGEFVETDEQAGKVVIKASGKDSRGNGTASATVTVSLTNEGSSTSATVLTDLSITGKPAQFGRGMISEVGGKILDTFAGCLSGKLAPEAAPGGATTTTEPTTEESTGSEESAENPKPRSTPRRRTSRTARAKSQPAGESAATAEQAGGAGAGGGNGSSGASAADAPALTVVNGNVTAAAVAAKPAAASEPAPETEPIDLLDYAGPSVAKRLVPVALGLLALFVVIRRLRRRGR